MRLLATILLFLVVGCAARQPLEELEAQAAITGDWSAVDRYKLIEKKMNRVQTQPVCRNGGVLVCHTKGEREECGCVSPLDGGLTR